MADSVHVAIRLRSLLEREQAEGQQCYWRVNENTIYQVSENGKPVPGISYTFDRVFDVNESNQTIYEDLCHPIVHSVMNGINGTIFAYGQTASGKTYTMTGGENVPGIIQLTIKEIFSAIENTPDKVFLLRMSYLEIYNDCLADLLSPSHSKSLKINETLNREVVISGLTEEVVRNESEVITLLSKGRANRHIGETAANARSSRSHAIFRMIIESRSGTYLDDSIRVSHLNMVDLAGSERAGQMGSTGERFKEGVCVNLSLLALGQTIKNLSSKESQFVNYRQSKLTRILQNSLGGNARTAIICTVTPTSIEQTLSTIKFASQAKCIQNQPVVNEVLNETALLRKYIREVARLTTELERLQRQTGPSAEVLSMQLREKDQRNLELEAQLRSLKENLVMSSHYSAANQRSFLEQRNRRRTWFGQCSSTIFQEDSFFSQQNRPEKALLSNACLSLGTMCEPLEENHPPWISNTTFTVSSDTSTLAEHKHSDMQFCIINKNDLISFGVSKEVQTQQVQMDEKGVQIDADELPPIILTRAVTPGSSHHIACQTELTCCIESSHPKCDVPCQTDIDSIHVKESSELLSEDQEQVRESVYRFEDGRGCLEEDNKELQEFTTHEKSISSCRKLDPLNSLVESLRRKLEHQEKMNEALNSRLASLKSSVMGYAALRLKLKRVIFENVDLKANLASIEQKLSQAKEQLAHCQQSVETEACLREEISEMASRCQHYQQLVHQEKQANVVLAKECETLKEQVTKLKMEENNHLGRSHPNITSTESCPEVRDLPWEGACSIVEGATIHLLHNRLYHTQKELQKTKREKEKLMQKLLASERLRQRRTFFNDPNMGQSQRVEGDLKLEVKPEIQAHERDKGPAQTPNNANIENMDLIIKTDEISKEVLVMESRPLPLQENQESNKKGTQPDTIYSTPAKNTQPYNEIKDAEKETGKSGYIMMP